MSQDSPKGLPPLNEKARDKLARKTRSWFWKRRLAAVEEITLRKDPSLITPLVARLGDAKAEVRVAARLAFLSMKDAAIPTLLIATQIPGLVGGRAHSMLRSLQFPNRVALMKLIRDENAITRSVAISEVRKLGRRGIPVLIHGLLFDQGEEETTWDKQRIFGRVVRGAWFPRSDLGTSVEELRQALISLGHEAAASVWRFL